MAIAVIDEKACALLAKIVPYGVGFLDHISIMLYESRLVWRNFCSELQVSIL